MRRSICTLDPVRFWAPRPKLRTSIQITWKKAIEHPDTDFILGHLGFDFEVREHRWLMDCIRLAETYPNVWLEPSALGSSTSDPTGEVLIEVPTLRFKGPGSSIRSFTAVMGHNAQDS